MTRHTQRILALRTLTAAQLQRGLAEADAKAQACWGTEHIQYMSLCTDIRNVLRTKSGA